VVSQVLKGTSQPGQNLVFLTEGGEVAGSQVAAYHLPSCKTTDDAVVFLWSYGSPALYAAGSADLIANASTPAGAAIATLAASLAAQPIEAP